MHSACTVDTYIEVPRLRKMLATATANQSIQTNSLDFTTLQPVHIDVNAICSSRSVTALAQGSKPAQPRTLIQHSSVGELHIHIRLFMLGLFSHRIKSDSIFAVVMLLESWS